MAFLDTTGSTIRIDAVITDEGRKRITQGTFKVVKFSLGDDEIDYSMYDMAATTGLEDVAILKPPIYEAFESRTANIHSGLVSYGNKDLLWLPILRINDKIDTSAKQYTMPAGRPRPTTTQSYVSGTFFYMAANEETALKLNDYFGEEKYILRDSDRVGTKIVIESGIDASIKATHRDGGGGSGVTHWGTRSNQIVYLIENGLVDNYYYISTDPRFVRAIYTPNKESYFRNAPRGAEETKIRPLHHLSRGAKTLYHRECLMRSMIHRFLILAQRRIRCLRLPGPGAQLQRLILN